MSPLASIRHSWSYKPAWAVLSERNEFGGAGSLLSLSAVFGVRERPEGEGRAASEDLSGYRRVVHGDFVVNRLVARDGAFAVSGLDGLISPAYWVLRARKDFDTRFVNYLLRSSHYLAEIGARSKAMPPAQFDLPWEQFRTLPIASPELSLQRDIADFLDTETARIDALITKKQRMVELLEMRFVGESTAYVLSGTRNTQTVQSRTGFYGLVPTGWKETSLRHLGCEVQTGPFGSQLHAEEYVENGWPVVNPQNLKEGRILPIADMCVSSEKRQDLGRHILRFGDIVFGRRGEMGRAGLVSEVEAGWLCGTGSLRLRLLSKEIVPEYFLLLLQTQAAKAYFQLSSVGSTMENLNSEILLDFPMLVPSVTEQSEIITRMAELRTKKDRMNTLVKEQVRLLSERRQALITAAVTGEFGIPEVAA